MANLLNYLPCPKCLNFSSNLIQLEKKRFEKENDLYLKLSCSQKCSINCIRFSELKQLLNNQEKVPMSIFIYGKFSQEQTQFENISSKIFNIIDKLYSDIEEIEKKICKMKEQIKEEIIRYKKEFEDFQLLHELIYGAYLRNIKDNINQDNNLILNNNIKLINIIDKDNFSIQNNFYKKEIEKDILNINNSIIYIKKEFSCYFKNNEIITINENNNNKSIFPLVEFSNYISNNINSHSEIESYNVSLKNIEKILKLSDGNIILGSSEQMIIYNLELKKEILFIPGDFSDIIELKYNKKYQTNKNNKNILILAVVNKGIKIYDIYNKSILLNYSQYYNIDYVLELYNGDILYICDFSIFNMNLKEEFKIYLPNFCFSMINLYDNQDILIYTNLSKIKFVYLNNPKKLIKEIEIKESREVFDLKQIYNENLNNNYLLILSSKYLDLYNLNLNEFKFRTLLNNNLYKKIDISMNNKNIFLLSKNSIKLFKIETDKFSHIHTIDSLKTKDNPFYSKIVTTPFCISNDGKYILIFESNEDGINLL